MNNTVIMVQNLESCGISLSRTEKSENCIPYLKYIIRQSVKYCVGKSEKKKIASEETFAG